MRPNELLLLMGINFVMYAKRIILFPLHRIKADMAVNVLRIILPTEIAFSG
jgi:hypothetical protein